MGALGNFSHSEFCFALISCIVLVICLNSSFLRKIMLVRQKCMLYNKLFAKEQTLEVTVLSTCVGQQLILKTVISTQGGYENLRLRKYFLAQICADILINNCVYNNCNLLYSLTARPELRANLKKITNSVLLFL